jgi:hypothetical protein
MIKPLNKVEGMYLNRIKMYGELISTSFLIGKKQKPFPLKSAKR